MILSPEARVALYWAPAPDDPLWSAGNAWLGRDPATNAVLSQPDLPDIAAITAEARRYGFHATLKPPMRLRPGRTWDELVARTAEIAGGIAAFVLPSFCVVDLDGFLALGFPPTPERADSRPPFPRKRESIGGMDPRFREGDIGGLRALCDALVAGLDELRAPPTEHEIARRVGMGLSPERKTMLLRWGYPDVFDSWVFHMTLTRRLTAAEAAIYQPAAERHFAEVLAMLRRIRDVSAFVQDAPGAPFTLVSRVPLRG